MKLKSGFTMIELLIAIAITGVVGMIITSVLKMTLESYTIGTEYIKLNMSANRIIRDILDGDTVDSTGDIVQDGLRNVKEILTARDDTMSFITNQTAIFKDAGSQKTFLLKHKVEDNDINNVSVFYISDTKILNNKNLSSGLISVYKDIANKLPYGGYKEGIDFTVDRKNGIITKTANIKEELVFVNYSNNSSEEIKNEVVNFLTVMPKIGTAVNERIDFGDNNTINISHINLVKGSFYATKVTISDENMWENLTELTDYIIDYSNGAIIRVEGGKLGKGDIIYIFYSYYNYGIEGNILTLKISPIADTLKIVYKPDKKSEDISDIVTTYSFNSKENKLYKKYGAINKPLSVYEIFPVDRRGIFSYFYNYDYDTQNTNIYKTGAEIDPSKIQAVNIAFKIKGERHVIEVQNLVGLER